jgi:hypothetical protein
VHNSLTNFLHLSTTSTKLTASEETYYSIISLLSAILLTSLTAVFSDPIPNNFLLLTTSLKSAIDTLHIGFYATWDPESRTEVYFALQNMHTISVLRDTAMAIKQSASYMIVFDEKEKARDRTSRPILHKQIKAEMKILEDLGTKVLGDVKARIKILKEKLSESGWLDEMIELTFGPEAEGGRDAMTDGIYCMVGGKEAVETWASRVLESWREGIKGWGMVKME